MAEPKIALLPDRGIVTVTGNDAAKFLQGLLTADLGQLGLDDVRLAALLTPQGKILFEVLVLRDESGALLLETDRRQAAALVQKLQLYKMRADVDMLDSCSDYTVAAGWNQPTIAAGAPVRTDSRHPDLGVRIYASIKTDRVLGEHDATAAPEPDYHAHRIALGIPQGGLDYDLGDTFPHEANFDLTGGVSFEKGCFIGQEVVSRMQHKSVVRKRVTRVEGTSPLPDDRSEVRAGATTIGRLGSVAGTSGLALLRLDRAAEAISLGQQITAGDIPLTVDTEMIERYRASAAAAAQGTGP